MTKLQLANVPLSALTKSVSKQKEAINDTKECVAGQDQELSKSSAPFRQSLHSYTVLEPEWQPISWPSVGTNHRALRLSSRQIKTGSPIHSAGLYP